MAATFLEGPHGGRGRAAEANWAWQALDRRVANGAGCGARVAGGLLFWQIGGEKPSATALWRYYDCDNS